MLKQPFLFAPLSARVVATKEKEDRGMLSRGMILCGEPFVTRTGYALELGLGLERPFDYGILTTLPYLTLPYSLEHIKEKPWEKLDQLYIDKSARKIPP